MSVNEKRSLEALYGQDLQSRRGQNNMSRSRLSPTRRLLLVAFPMLLAVWLLVTHMTYDKQAFVRASVIKHQPYHLVDQAQKAMSSASNSSGLVPLEAHIMSKCPDARDCLRDLVVPAMEQLVDMVDFTLSFIGR